MILYFFRKIKKHCENNKKTDVKVDVRPYEKYNKLMKIGIDIDNVIANTFDELRHHFNRFMGKEYAAHEIVYALRKNKLKTFFYNVDAWRKKVLETVSPIPSAVDKIREWFLEHEIYLVTSRLFVLKNQTKRWLLKHNVPHHGLFHLKEGTKFKKAKEYDAFIEDNFEECEILAEHCPKVFLIDKPWNRKKSLKKNIVRIKDWEEFKKYI